MPTPPRCVLVDDDPDFERFTRLHLEKVCPRLEIVSFCSGLEALGYLTRHQADLLITDFHMPFLDGLRLTRHVRAADTHVSIVVMSGEAIETEALATGADAFVLKHELLTHLGALLDRLGFTPSPAA